MTLYEEADFFLIVRICPVYGLQNELIVRDGQRIENTSLHIHNVLRARVVVSEPDQIGFSESKSPSLRVRPEAARQVTRPCYTRCSAHIVIF